VAKLTRIVSELAQLGRRNHEVGEHAGPYGSLDNDNDNDNDIDNDNDNDNVCFQVQEMALEIERKFLVKKDSWRSHVESEARIMQGYLANNATATVRVRVKGAAAFLTIKGAGTGISRSEYEYPIPVEDAQAMLRDLAVFPPIDKVRYRVRSGRHIWDLDIFAGENAGLVMAEVELATVDEAFERPDWLGEEVSGDPRYFNVNLARNPYKRW
jgi:adenylate cyclase